MEDNYNLLDMEPDRDSFLFYVSWYKWISTLKKRAQILAFTAICEYSLFSKPIPKEGFSLSEYATLCSFVPIMKKHKANYENGKKGAVHGCKGGRPKMSETPTGLSDKTATGLRVATPTDTVSVNHAVTEKETDYVTDTAEVETTDMASCFKELEDELLAIFFFKNNCHPAPELKKFYEFYNGRGWKLGGGKVIDSMEALKRAAESWTVKEPIETGFTPNFMKGWKEVYNVVPDSLKREFLKIKTPQRSPTSSKVIGPEVVKEWLSKNKEKVQLIFKSHATYNYKIEW